ncbi:hypothetical protein [Pedobacter polaris]|uniref:hypothetical protein n=1 Tax=Pedobacter polaris TaxID=2571273 RepID=UPI00145E69E2|nr:hypothetical protein [Pedobacter polaris]
MIIKLHTPFTYARHKEEKITKPLTLQEKVKADRIFMAILLMLTIIGAVVFV